MYKVIIYDYYNHEITWLTKEFKNIETAKTYAMIQSMKHAKSKCYATVEDENFDKLAWYENGENIWYN